MMETKKNNLRSARSLSGLLAIAFFVLSVVILLVSGGLQLFFNIRTQQQAISSQQQVIAQDAARTVSSFIEENFSILSTTVGLIHPNTLLPAAQTQIAQSLLANQPAFRQFAIFDINNNETAMASRVQNAGSATLTSLVTDGVFAQTQQGQRYISSLYIDSVTDEP